MAGSALLNARALLESVGIRRGDRVADFGAGRTAHLVFPAARLVGEDGAVYAVDIHPDALAMIDGHRKLHAQNNLETVWGDIERVGGVAIPSSTLDVIFLVNTLWQARNHVGIALEARRLLRPGGRVVVVDWHPLARHPVAPPMHLRVPEHAVDAAFVGAGLQNALDLVPSPWHFGRVYAS